MKYRYLLAATAVAMVFAGSAAMAAPIDLGGYTGPVTIKYSDYESFTGATSLPETGGNATTCGGPASCTLQVPAPAAGSFNYGIFAISSVGPGNIPTNILNSGPYTYVGVFSGIQTTSVAPSTSGAGGTGFGATTTGGIFSLYQVLTSSLVGGSLATTIGQGTAGYAAAGCAVNSQCYNGITNVGATMVLQFALNNSIDPNYSLTNNQGNVVNLGSSGGTATVTGGADASQFGPSLTIQNNFCFNTPGGLGTGACSTFQSASVAANSWGLLSQDPVNATVVPEPATVALFGAGFLGLGLLARRRRKVA